MTTHCEINPQLIRTANEKFHVAKKEKYEKDKLTSDTPWKLWEFCDSEWGNTFVPCQDEPLWWEKYQYRHIDPQEKPYPLETYGKMLIIVRKNEQGQYEGYCENSFSMDWIKNYCRIYTSNTMYSILGTHNLDAIKDVEDVVKRFTLQLKLTPQYREVESRVAKMTLTIQKCKDTQKRNKLQRFVEQILTKYIEQHKFWEIYDPTSDDCPIDVALQTWTLARSNRNSRKFSCRNASFKLKTPAV